MGRCSAANLHAGMLVTADERRAEPWTISAPDRAPSTEWSTVAS